MKTEIKIKIQCKRCGDKRDTTSKKGIVTCTGCGRKIVIAKERVK